MEIEPKHDKAARLLAQGHSGVKTAQAIGVSESSIDRWKRKAEFKTLVARYSEPVKSAIEENLTPEFIDAFQEIPEAESEMISKLEAITKKLGDVVFDRLEGLTDDEIAELPTRLIPNFIRSYVEGIQAIQDANDRCSGYQLVAEELGKIIEAKNSRTN